MNMIIAYIYIVAAIMIMKDGNRTAGEAVTVEGEILKTGEEENDNKDEEKEDEKKEKLPEKKEKDKEEIPKDNDNKENKTKKEDKGD